MSQKVGCYLDDYVLDGGGGLLGQRAARRHDQLYGVADDDGVVHQVPVVSVLQDRALDKLAVAMAIPGIRILRCTTKSSLTTCSA